MELSLLKEQTSFSLPTDVLNILKHKAALANRTLNSYVESVLTAIAYADVTKDNADYVSESLSTALQELKDARENGRSLQDIDDFILEMEQDGSNNTSRRRV